MAESASLILHQAALYSGLAASAQAGLVPLAWRPCPSALPALDRLAAFTPHVRSVAITESDRVTCSSLTGGRPDSVVSMYGLPRHPSGAARWMSSRSSTPVLPGYAAVLYARRIDDVRSGLVVMDARDITEQMDALTRSHGLAFSLRFGGGDALTGGRFPDAMLLGGLRHASGSHGVWLTARAPASTVLKLAAGNLPLCLSLSALISSALILGDRYRARRRASMARTITAGMRLGEFRVHYQPVCAVQTGQCRGAEALMRWTRADGRVMGPDVFIAAAEEEDMIIPLTRHLFSLIARDVRTWAVADGFRLGVNVAAVHLLHPDFQWDAAGLREALAGTGIRVMFEITERSLVGDVAEAVRVLERLRAAGFLIALDDFGTGYSSLSYLQHLPLDCLKIDRSFTESIPEAGGDTRVLDAILGLSRQLRLETVAEGVSREMQRRWLAQRGVPLLQGYLCTPPLDNSAFTAWMKEQRDRPWLPADDRHVAGKQKTGKIRRANEEDLW